MTLTDADANDDDSYEDGEDGEDGQDYENYGEDYGEEDGNLDHGNEADNNGTYPDAGELRSTYD